MKVIIMGCGRVGVQLARLLVDEGHQVAVIDYDANALTRLEPNFKVKKLSEWDLIRMSCSRQGLSTLMHLPLPARPIMPISWQRVSLTTFSMSHVWLPRLFDPQRAEIYRRLGMLTISSTTWGAERIRELLTSAEIDPIHSFGSGEVSLVNIEVPAQLVGRMVKDLTVTSEIAVVAVTRQGAAFIPTLGSQFKDGDIMHVAILASALERFEALLGLSEGG